MAINQMNHKKILIGLMVLANICFLWNFELAPSHKIGSMNGDMEIAFLQTKEICYLLVWLLYNTITFELVRDARKDTELWHKTRALEGKES
jgi:hypothetical protein